MGLGFYVSVIPYGVLFPFVNGFLFTVEYRELETHSALVSDKYLDPVNVSLNNSLF